MSADKELRAKIYRISLTPINDIYYVPPGTDGSVGLSDKKIDQIMKLISQHDATLKQKLMDALPEELKPDSANPQPLLPFELGENNMLKQVILTIQSIFKEEV